MWGVTPIVNQESTTETFLTANKLAKDMKILKEGDLVVQTAGTLTGVSGSTNLVKVGYV